MSELIELKIGPEYPEISVSLPEIQRGLQRISCQGTTHKCQVHKARYEKEVLESERQTQEQDNERSWSWLLARK